MAKKSKGKKSKKQVETILHEEASRKYIPTAEYEPVMREEDKKPILVAYERRNPDLDPQLVWRGKDIFDWSDLVIPAPPLYIQEKVHPKVLVDDLIRETERYEEGEKAKQLDFFDDFNGLPNEAAKTDFYQHEANWTNRMILGDSLQVMASLAEREGLRGSVQCIYVDPPYGINFNSNFQWSTTNRDVKDGRADHITREPEQVKAYRDTWRDGIHTYLTYMRDRLSAAKPLLNQTGSIFIQIGEENSHLMRSIADEVFGESNFCRQIYYTTTSFLADKVLANTVNIILWYAKDKAQLKSRALFGPKNLGDAKSGEYKWLVFPDRRTRSLTQKEAMGINALPAGARAWRHGPLTSQGSSEAGSQPFNFQGRVFSVGNNQHWKVSQDGLMRLAKADLLIPRRSSLSYFMFLDAFPITPTTNVWLDTKWGFNAGEKSYVVETNSKVIERCLLMATDPGDLVLDPTCGSGTTAFVSEQWGRRWITIDTSRVALALARARIMGARYPFYLLADSTEGKQKISELTRKPTSDAPTFGRIRQGFVYERAPHIMLSTISNNTEIDVIWEKWQPQVEKALEDLNASLRGHGTPFVVEEGGRAGTTIDFTSNDGETISLPSGEDAPANGFLDWEVPRDAPEGWPDSAKRALIQFWEVKIAQQEEMDASIAAASDFEYLYDRPYEDSSKIRVAGPFTVESLAPHRTLVVGENDELIVPLDDAGGETEFIEMIIENLKIAGVQQPHKEDRIDFVSLTPWPGRYICAEGRYLEGNKESGAEKRAGIFIGPEFGTVSRPDLVAATREAADADFDALVACAFSYDAQSTEFNKLGRIPVLKARMNADLHMGEELKSTRRGNLFVIFGEPDIELIEAEDDKIQVKLNGVDVFDPTTGEVRSDNADGIACWFIDTDYNEEGFFVRHAYFLGANDPYQSLKTSLKAEINKEAWESLHSDTSRPFEKPESGRIAVKVINHLGDEVMKVFRVE